MQEVNPEMEVFRPGLTKAVKMASAQYSTIPGFEEMVNEHVDKLLVFYEMILKAKPL